MNRVFVLATALFALVGCQEETATATDEVSPAGTEYRLLHLPDDMDVTIQIAWGTDWAYRPETNKAAPLIGTQLILAGGADGYAAGDAGERFADLNSEGNIYVAVNDHVMGELAFERANLDDTIERVYQHKGTESPTGIFSLS